MAQGSLRQRHLASCPRKADGSYAPHRCRGTWQYQLDLGRDADGRRIKDAKSGFSTRRDAERALAEARERLQGKGLLPHRLTVRDYLAQWLVGKRGIRPTTYRNYKSHVDNYINPTIGDLRLVDLRAPDVERLIAVVGHGRRGRTVSAITVRRVHGTLRTALNAAVRRRLVSYNAAAHVDLPSAQRAPRPVWSAPDFNVFWQASRGDRLAALYRLAVVAGLRRGELLGLRWTDLDLDAGVAQIVQQIVDVNGRLHLGPPKSRRGERAVAVDRRTIKELSEHADRQAVERLSAGSLWQENDLVFCRDDGSPLRPEFVTRHFQYLARRAGLQPIRFHDLRHTSASLALEAGIPMKVVSDRLGHSSTTITADLYTHVSRTVSFDAAQALAAVLDDDASASWGSPEGDMIMKPEEEMNDDQD